MEKEKGNAVIPTEGLLSDMMSLEIHGGTGGVKTGETDIYYYCNVRSVKCLCTNPCKVYLFCGQNIDCKCETT